jgi:hypothetical protein
MRMFDQANGRFYTGTVDSNSVTAPGNCADVTIVADQDRINTCDFLDSNTFTLLPMALSEQYGGLIDWKILLLYSLSHFGQTVTAAGKTWDGFNLVPVPTSNANGISWEFTGQMVESMRYLDRYLNATFQPIADRYLAQIQQAQTGAPFGDGMGLPASTLQNGDSVRPVMQCLSTPFQCIPERVGLAATNWGIYADTAFNPLAFGALIPSLRSIPFSDQPQGTVSQTQTLSLTNIGLTPVAFQGVNVIGANATEFRQTNTCTLLSVGSSCTIQVTFTPSGPDARLATLQVASDAIGGSLPIPMSGNSLPTDNFSVSATLAPQIVIAGNSASLTVTTAITRGTSQAIDLSGACAGLPVNGHATIQAGDAAVTFQIPTTTATTPGTYSCTVIAKGSSFTRTAIVSIKVTGPITITPALWNFGPSKPGAAASAATFIVSNGGTKALPIFITVGGAFSGDFAQTNTCGFSLGAGTNCSISVTFSPRCTGPRQAAVLVLDTAGDTPQTAQLSGSGHSLCAGLSDCGYQLVNGRASAGTSAFYVYKDADSGLNHGFPSGIFGSPQRLADAVTLDAGCIDSAASVNGCSTSVSSLDVARGTVFRATLPVVPSGVGYAGLNFQEPQNYDATKALGAGYTLTWATAVQFDVRSPDGAVVQFGVGGCTTGARIIGPDWSTVRFSLGPPDLSCVPDLGNVYLLFAVATTPDPPQSGGTVLLDNVQFLPANGRPSNEHSALSLPAGTETFGALPAQHPPIPPDQVNRGVASVREAALSVIALLRRGRAQDVSNGTHMADALDYALYHDNHGDPIPEAPGSAAGCYSGAAPAQCGLHSAYFNGDIAFVNPQLAPGLGQAGDSRLAGFSAGAGLCGASGFCLVLDGASGGNNALAILAFLEAYHKSGDTKYLNDATVVAKWIAGNLDDTSSLPFGGYFVGYNDGGLPKPLIVGKSTADNAMIFAAFSGLAQVLAGLGQAAEAARWTAAANSAGDFISRMLVPSTGRFAPGTARMDGAESRQATDSLDANTLAVLALAGVSRYQSLNLKQTLLFAMAKFRRSVTTAGVTDDGFQLATPPSGSPAGIWWEGTAQMVEAMRVVDASAFADPIAHYLSQMQTVQTQTPFGDGLGLPVVTLQDGELLPPYEQCLRSPYGCLPERVGLAATVWGIAAELGINLLQPRF